MGDTPALRDQSERGRARKAHYGPAKANPHDRSEKRALRDTRGGGEDAQGLRSLAGLQHRVVDRGVLLVERAAHDDQAPLRGGPGPRAVRRSSLPAGVEGTACATRTAITRPAMGRRERTKREEEERDRYQPEDSSSAARTTSRDCPRTISPQP